MCLIADKESGTNNIYYAVDIHSMTELMLGIIISWTRYIRQKKLTVVVCLGEIKLAKITNSKAVFKEWLSDMLNLCMTFYQVLEEY